MLVQQVSARFVVLATFVLIVLVVPIRVSGLPALIGLLTLFALRTLLFVLLTGLLIRLPLILAGSVLRRLPSVLF